jgi:hypothetical protein
LVIYTYGCFIIEMPFSIAGRILLMMKARIAEYRFVLQDRLLPDGGFAEHRGSAYRTDATAWAILALADRSCIDTISRARSRLAAGQLEDGRVSISVEHPRAFWPTALAALAWHGSVSHKDHQDRAISFLLQTAGRHWERKPDDVWSHDAAIRGWPWIENTFSWVQPTALALLALRLSGNSGHSRAREAMRMIMDRQLPHGGWNYGNAIVYGQELYPQPESTGMALAAIAGGVERKEVELSIRYLNTGRYRTPLSLGWALLGLGAWGERPRGAQKWIVESLHRQGKYGEYGTTLLSLLILAYQSEGDVIAFLASRKNE